MKKIIDLKAERAEIISKMEVIANGETLNEEQRSEWNANDAKVKGIDEEIALLERQEELNKKNIRTMENTKEKQPVAVEFRDWLVGAVKEGKSNSFVLPSESLRADVLITSTDADMITKTVAPGIDVLIAPGEAFLRQLGATIYTGLVGNFSVPSMDQDLAAFVAEDASGAQAGMTPDSLVLAARRVTHMQRITKETLAQTNPGVYASILQNLVDGVWRAVTNDYFDTLETDAATQIKVTGATATNTDIVNMEASIGGLNIGGGAYVTTPTGKALFKTTIARGTTAGDAIWMNNEMNGYPAYGVPAANANRVYFGDWSRQVVGQWGGLEIIVDPYSGALQGEIRLTAIGLFDTGCANKRAFAILDASLS